MMLSDLSTDRAADVLCELTPYIAGITADEELLEELRAAIDIKGVSTRAELLLKGIEKITKITPIILKKRKRDVFGILAVLNEKTVEAVAAQNFIITLKQIRDIAKDRDLIDFFKSCADVDRTV